MWLILAFLFLGQDLHPKQSQRGVMATRGLGHTIAGAGRLIQKPADALASRAGDLAATAEAATMRRPGLGVSTAQTAGGLGRTLETMGELFKAAGTQMEKAPSRVGLLRSIEYSPDIADNIRRLAGRGPGSWILVWRRLEDSVRGSLPVPLLEVFWVD